LIEIIKIDGLTRHNIGSGIGEKISGVHFKLIVLTLKLRGATGSPVRAIMI